MYSCMVSLSIF